MLISSMHPFDFLTALWMFCVLLGTASLKSQWSCCRVGTVSTQYEYCSSLLVWAPTISLVAVIPAAELNITCCIVLSRFLIVYYTVQLLFWIAIACTKSSRSNCCPGYFRDKMQKAYHVPDSQKGSCAFVLYVSTCFVAYCSSNIYTKPSHLLGKKITGWNRCLRNLVTSRRKWQ